MGKQVKRMETCDFEGIIAFLLGLLAGTGSSITIKIVYMMSAIGIDGEIRKFEKPLSTTLIMFLAMSFALPLHFFYQKFFNSQERPKFDPKVLRILIIPASFDLLGTILSGIGLLYTTVSVFQLVRCTVIIITAFLKSCALNESLRKYMLRGVAINTLAMILVSSTTFFEPQESGRDSRIGVLFILLSCVVQGSQYVFEEKVMSTQSVPPLIVVGMEGVWGTVLMLAIAFPVAYWIPGNDKGCYENIFDSIEMARNSVQIQITLFAFFVTVAFYNVFAIVVTNLLSSIWHAILDNFRPVSVWGTDLAIYYWFTNGKFGEPWTKYSYLQLIGMCLLFFGTAVYNGSIPWFYGQDDYEHIVTPKREGLDGLIRAPEKFTSPALMRSPLVRKGSFCSPNGTRSDLHEETYSLNSPQNNIQNYSSTKLAKDCP